jgi:type IV pilus assembly protein PilA
MKKGFTLMELLAVIIILAAVAIVVMPAIVSTIESSRKSAAQVSASNYIDALNTAIAARQVSNDTEIINGTYYLGELTDLGITVQVKKPTDGEVTIDNGVVKNYYLAIDDYKVKNDGTNTTITKTDGVNIEPYKLYTYATQKGVMISSNLYAFDNGYLYVGSTVNNYFKFKDDNTIYRIIGYYDDGTMKLVSTDTTHNIAFDANSNRTTESTYCILASTNGCNYYATSNDISGKTVLNDSTIKVYLDNWYSNLDSNIKDKIIKHDFNNGFVTPSGTYDNALTMDKSSVYNGYVALLSVSDVLKSASTKLTTLGTNQTVSTSYIVKIAGNLQQVWLMNGSTTNTFDEWTFSYGTNFGVKRSSRTDQGSTKFYVLPAFYISRNIYITGTGTSTDPFVVVK